MRPLLLGILMTTVIPVFAEEAPGYEVRYECTALEGISVSAIERDRDGKDLGRITVTQGGLSNTYSVARVADTKAFHILYGDCEDIVEIGFRSENRGYLKMSDFGGEGILTELNCDTTFLPTISCQAWEKRYRQCLAAHTAKCEPPRPGSNCSR